MKLNPGTAAKRLVGAARGMCSLAYALALAACRAMRPALIFCEFRRLFLG